MKWSEMSQETREWYLSKACLRPALAYKEWSDFEEWQKRLHSRCSEQHPSRTDGRMTMKKFIVRVIYDDVVEGKNQEDAIENARLYLRQNMHHYFKLISAVSMPDDTQPCEYGKLNRTCDGTKCKVCVREEWLQAMNEDASDRKHGLLGDEDDMP